MAHALLVGMNDAEIKHALWGRGELGLSWDYDPDARREYPSRDYGGDTFPEDPFAELLAELSAD
jgi:hypothetical protein